MTTIDTTRVGYLNAQLDALAEVGKSLRSGAAFERRLQQMLQLLHQRLQLERCLIALVDSQQGALQIVAIQGRELPPKADLRYRLGEGILGEVLQEGVAVVLRRIADAPQFLNRLGLYDPLKPFIAVPIRDDQVVRGVLAAQPDEADGWIGDRRLDDDRRLMEVLADWLVPLVASQPLLIATGTAANGTVHGMGTAPADRSRREARGRFGFDHIIGRTPHMLRVFEQMRQVAKWNTTVLIRGESGTGKELVANGIHYASPRANAPFIKLNCAVLSDNLLESELFGHEKGAFTGAMNQRKGRFEQANGGTLFLDELGEISPAFQAKLLRVLQEGEFERIGGTQTLKVDVRIIAATNRDLESAVEMNEFREDLYYRLNVMPIYMPPLRERLDDINDLARFLVAKIAKQQQRPLEINDSAVRLLMRHDWPGNVRELENTLERASVMTDTGRIDRELLALTGLEDKVVNRDPGPLAAAAAGTKVDLADPHLDERERVIAALEQSGWVQAKAARLLNMTPRQIAYRIQILNIRLRRF